MQPEKKPTTPIPVSPANPELRKRFLDWFGEQSPAPSNAALAKMLGANSTQVSKYRHDRFQGNIEKFEAALADFLKSDSSRKKIASELFDTQVTDEVASILNLIRATNDVALIYAPAGKGKTSASMLFAARNASSVYIRLDAWNANPSGVAARLFQAVDNQSWPGNVNRTQWIADRFAGSNRLIILDNAQRLTAHGLTWVFDFHDATECPIAFVGPDEVLNKIRLNAQHFSRVGIVHEIGKSKDGNQVVTNMIALHMPDGMGHVEELALAVLKGPGHSRSLKKQLLLAAELMDGGISDPEQAFAAAGQKLIR
jgi:DNA transposition AAA+ family ATPase